MSISKRAMDARAAQREKRKNFISERTLSALNEELNLARTAYPGNAKLLNRTRVQLERLIREIDGIQSGGTHLDQFDIWNTGIIALVLIVRFLEEGNPSGAYIGLRGELESELDKLAKLVGE